MANPAVTAERLVEKNGRLVTIAKINREAADSSKPWRGSTPPDHSSEGGDRISAIAAFVPPRGTGFGRNTEADAAAGALDRGQRQTVLVASRSMPPGTDLTEYDRIIDRDRTWRIVFAEELAPGTESVLWSVEVTA